jgi:hypothetical protein
MFSRRGDREHWLDDSFGYVLRIGNAKGQTASAADQAAPAVLAQKRSKWLDAKLEGNSDVDLDKTKKISYNTVQRYRSGRSILPKSRRGLCDALNVLGISCRFSDVP